MVKIIHVMGVGSSGKTSSIKLFLEHYCGLSLGAGDVREMVIIVKNRKFYTVGVASGGDNPAIIKANFNFVKPYKPDIIICPSRKVDHPSHTALLGYVTLLSADYDKVDTTQIDKRNTTLKYEDNKRVSDEIWANIP